MAESSTQSNSKPQTLSPGKDAVVDRISSLPESLLCHILSFLPTKESIATSILSTRWKLLWTLVPKLFLDSDKISASELSLDDGDVEGACDFMFALVVSSVLAKQECGELQTFRLKWQFCWQRFWLNTNLDAWLGTAAARKVKELDLYIFMNDIDEENLKLPPSFFSCRTLVVLKLSGDIDIDIDIDTPSLSFNFPSLKILHLLEIVLPNIMYSQEHSFLRLLSGCPVLEELSFTTTDFSMGEYKLCVPTLKRLSFGETDFNYSDYELEINAPALEYFKFYGRLRDIKFYEKLDNVVQSDVYISICDYVPEGFRRKWVFNLFAALNNVKFLSFSPRGTEWHNLGNIYPSSFQNLVELKFNNNKKYYIDIIETKPANAISIIETDCEVDFAPPLDYKEPEKPIAPVPLGKAPAEEAPAETEPKFSPFTGSGRRLDGKPLNYQPPSVAPSQSKDKQPNVANGNAKPSAGSSSQSTNRQAQGKLVFGSNVSRTPKDTPKEPAKETKQEQPSKSEEPKFQAFSGKKYSLRG